MNQDTLNKIVSASPKSIFRKLRRELNPKAPLADFDEEHPCVFFLSTGRVGSRTLASLCDLARNVEAYHEPLPSLFAYSRHSYLYSDGPGMAQVLQDVVRTTRSEAIMQALLVGKGYVETGPQGTFLAPFLQACWPQAKFVHIVRHPRDVIRSGMRRNWYAGHPFDPTRIVPREASAEASEWEAYSQIRKNAWLWTETNRWIGEFMDQLPAGKGLSLRSEALFACDLDTIAMLFEMLASPVPSTASLLHVLEKKFNAQTSGDLPDNWQQVLQGDLEAVALPVMTRYGYRL